MSDKICPKTSHTDYPHHWDCVHKEGHLGCTCWRSDSCWSFDCTVSDGTRRFPDGSHICEKEIKEGKLCVLERNFSAGESKVFVII
jgi:hypothetical protein